MRTTGCCSICHCPLLLLMPKGLVRVLVPWVLLLLLGDKLPLVWGCGACLDAPHAPASSLPNHPCGLRRALHSAPPTCGSPLRMGRLGRQAASQFQAGSAVPESLVGALQSALLEFHPQAVYQLGLTGKFPATCPYLHLGCLPPAGCLPPRLTDKFPRYQLCFESCWTLFHLRVFPTRLTGKFPDYLTKTSSSWFSQELHLQQDLHGHSHLGQRLRGPN